MDNKYKFIKIQKSNKSNKKYDAIYENTKTGRQIIKSFGQSGAEDYLIHKDKERRARYINRHLKDLNTGDPKKPGFLSLIVTWGKKTTLQGGINDYRRLYNGYLKNKSIEGFKNYVKSIHK